MSLGHPAGQTGVYRPVSQGFPVVYYGKTDIFAGTPAGCPRDTRPSRGFSDNSCNFFLCSGTKKEPKPKFFGPDISRSGWGLPREGVGAKKFGMSLEIRQIKLFGRDIPGFCRDIPAAPEKFEKKRLCPIFGPYSRPFLLPI